VSGEVRESGCLGEEVCRVADHSLYSPEAATCSVMWTAVLGCVRVWKSGLERRFPGVAFEPHCDAGSRIGLGVNDFWPQPL
jgi:hypothetical protein